jgi:PAS domain S-box-containing protein
MHSQLTEHILSLEPGGHLCLFYRKDPAEQMAALVPFIQDAITHDEQFIYIADDQTVGELSFRLGKSGINVAAEIQRGRLKLWTRSEWRQPGQLDSDKKAQQVRGFTDQAAKSGFKGARFAVEMTWTLGPDIDTRQLEHWEASINTLFKPSFPGRIVCQYNNSRLSADVLLAALHTHPEVIIGEDVYPNFFYQAPLILGEDRKGESDGNVNSHDSANGNGHATTNGKTSRDRLEWMLAQLERARRAEKERQEMLLNHARFAQASQLADANGRLAAIIESSEDAIVSKGLDGVIASWNKGAEQIFGYTAAEAIGQHITILIPPELQDEEPSILGRIRRGERIVHYETVRRRKDGTLLDISLTVSPVKDAQGKIIGASKIARDITEQKRANVELRQAKEQLARTNEDLEQRVDERTASLRAAIAQMEEFSYSVSHDLRAPVRAMQGYANAALELYGERLDARGRDFLDRIIRGSTRMDRLIQDVLTYSRIARSEIQLQPVSLQKLVPDVIQHYPEMQSPRAEIVIRDPLLDVVAHEPSLTQAISNLLSNGVKFVAPGSVAKLQIWTELRQDKVRLWVEDNGIGIKPEHQSRLFGMFERIHPDKQYNGTGIGLAIVRKAVERMGGSAGVESDGITGSSFWIELPAARNQ